MIERLVLETFLGALRIVRRVLGAHPRAYAILGAAWAQPLLEWLGRLRLRLVFLKAQADCPAYARFLAAEGYRARRPWRLADVPVTTKENYVKKYTIEERCYGGVLGGGGQVIDESSGSSGVPNNWVRSASERRDVRRVLQLSYGLMYGDERRMLLNCFALGPWATGMNVSMSLADVGILKSIGPDARKLERTLEMFGPNYRYLVFGYPPFVKSFVDSCTLDLSGYALDLVVGGEGISENLRAYLGRTFRSIVSSYGASDLEINLGIETEWTIALRARCTADPALSRALFGRDVPPMIFQFNPVDYHAELLPSGELAFTMCRNNGAAPKLRYNLKDQGGASTFRALAQRLAERGLAPEAVCPRFGWLPVLWVYGRSDLTVAFYGAKVYPADFEAVILGSPELAPAVGRFQFASLEDVNADRTLAIALELAPGAIAGGLDTTRVAELFYRGLAAANQDFREVSRMFDASALAVTLHPHGTGPFEGADIRLKNQYVRPA